MNLPIMTQNRTLPEAALLKLPPRGHPRYPEVSEVERNVMPLPVRAILETIQ